SALEAQQASNMPPASPPAEEDALPEGVYQLASSDSAPRPAEGLFQLASREPALRLGEPETAPPAPAPEVAMLAPLPAAPAKKRVRPEDDRSGSVSLPDPESRTAIYDIAAHVVYLPNGERLEAHSGLGGLKDDPRHVSLRNRGPTPPNVYNLVLRERVFHGVRAIRLIPAGSGNMYGRDGILAHSYMLGPSGQSNGCVAFSNYPAFLRAFQKGEVERLVVVSRLANPPVRAA